MIQPIVNPFTTQFSWVTHSCSGPTPHPSSPAMTRPADGTLCKYAFIDSPTTTRYSTNTKSHGPLGSCRVTHEGPDRTAYSRGLHPYSAYITKSLNFSPVCCPAPAVNSHSSFSSRTAITSPSGSTRNSSNVTYKRIRPKDGSLHIITRTLKSDIHVVYLIHVPLLS